MIARAMGPARRSDVRRRVGLVDPHPVMRRGLRAILAAEPDLEVVGEADGLDDAVELVRRCEPAILVAEASGAGGHDAVAIIRRLRTLRPSLGLLLFSAAGGEGPAERCLRAGADGVLGKHEPEHRVLEAIRTVLAGGSVVPPGLLRRMVRRDSPVDALTDRECEVLEWIGRGESTRAIAAVLGLSVRTIESHRANIKRKLGIGSAPRLIRFAVRWVGGDAADPAAAPLSPR